ncbi:hypothetical protein Agabi119p4_2517 [Agaricus bisporus var. burnettii]|uniref:RNA-directed DNA polymerase n=1 Tax=Agaricus bisporus var. burnettii TaxID=192524 RepID=A0A8H7F965_AGABI|nr:hypothetical protein Agabi119p4_2517 [Agaricus bisporus var. burnettii]
MFMDKAFAEEEGFKLEPLERPIPVKNVDGTINASGAVTHRVAANVYYKGHKERVHFEICGLGKNKVILGMPWLQMHNPEIDWEKGEVKMTRCPDGCGYKDKGKAKEKQEEIRKVEEPRKSTRQLMKEAREEEKREKPDMSHKQYAGWKLISFPKKSSWGTVLQYRCEECGIQTSEHLLSKHKCPAREEIALDEFGMPYEGSDDEEEGPTMAKIEAYEKKQEEIRDEEDRFERVNKAIGRFTQPKNIIEGIALGVEAAFARELARNKRANGGAEGLAQQSKEKAEGWAQSPGDVADRVNGDKAERLEEDNIKTATAGKAEAGQVRPKRISAQRKNRSREEGEQLETWVRGMAEEMLEDKEIRSIDSVEQAVPKRFHRFLKVFKQKESERMPTRKPWDHAIELKEGFKPKKGKIYPLSPNEREEVQAFVKDQLRKGYIRPSKSPQTSPVFFVPKKDGKKRMVQDYRFLNDWTIKNNYPLPLISELIDTMGSKRLFSKIDLRWGYNNIRIKEGDEWKAAFTTFMGAFEPTVMFFGLTNSPATFQTMMNELFRDLVNTGKVAVFIDDILIGMDNEEEHDKVVEEVLQRLMDNDLFAKPEKCEWKRSEMGFLGCIIGRNGIKMEERKVKDVVEWPTPKCVKDVQRFLGLANYYRRFIEKFASIAKPLHALTKKDKKWSWGDEEEKAFGALKAKFTSHPILVAPELDKELKVESDASAYATGGELSMKCEDGKWRPVAYISKSMTETERNYDIHDREMLGIMRCLEEWRHFLEGAKHKFEIWTDHRNLEYFAKAQQLNRRQARWALYLSRFNFELKFRPGKTMGKADALSRRPDFEQGTKDDNKDQTLLKPEYFAIRAMEEGHMLINAEEGEILDEIRKSEAKEDDVVKAVEEMKRAKVKSLRGDEWRLEEGLVLKEGKVYVPRDETLRTKIIRLHHDTPIAGHGGQWKTVEMVTRNYWWPGVTKQVQKYVEGCDQCQRNKNRPTPPAGKLMPNPIPTKPWADVSVDFIVKLPESQGMDSILVVCDRFSKMAHFIPTTETTSALGLAKLFRDHVWKLHGLPETVISDRGPQFAADFTKELNKMLGIDTRLSTAFHPQTDGQTERTNQELEQYLRSFVDHRQTDWPDWLATAEFSYNNKEQSSTKETPFMVNVGRHPRTGFDLRRQGNHPAAADFADRMKLQHEETQAALKKAQDDMRRYADRGRGEAVKYKVGDKILLATRDLQIQGRPTRKLTEKFIGPYTVKKIISPNAVELDLPRSIRIHPVVNVSRIVMYREQVEGQGSKPAPAVEIEGEQEWEVEKILNAKWFRGKKRYLVRWKGYTAEADSWEPEENLANAKELITEFHQLYGELNRIHHILRDTGFQERELPNRFTAKALFGWDDKQFDAEYLKKLERNWRTWRS